MTPTTDTVKTLLDQTESLHLLLMSAEPPSEAVALLAAAETLGPRLEKLGTTLYTLREPINSAAHGLARQLQQRTVAALKKGDNDPANPAFLRPAAAFDIKANRCNVTLVEPAKLPPGHPAKTLVPTEDLYRCGNRLCLVLGRDTDPFIGARPCGI